MKLRNILLGLAVFASALSVSGCAKEIDLSTATAIIEKNDAKEDPEYTKAVLTVKVEKLEVIIPEELESMGVTEDAVKELFLESGDPIEDSVEELTEFNVFYYSKEELIDMITSDEEYLESLKMTADGDKLTVEMSYFMEQDGMKLTMVSKSGFNEFNYLVYEYRSIAYEMILVENSDPIFFNYIISGSIQFFK